MSETNQPVTAAKVIHGYAPDQIQTIRNKRRSELNAKETQVLQEALTIKERLERKLKTDIVELKIMDDLGEFTLKFRKLTPQEHDRASRIQRDLRTKAEKDPELEHKLTQELYELLGHASLDGLDEDFWKSGIGFSPDIFVTAILKVMAASSFPDDKYFDQITKFRP